MKALCEKKQFKRTGQCFLLAFTPDSGSGQRDTRKKSKGLHRAQCLTRRVLRGEFDPRARRMCREDDDEEDLSEELSKGMVSFLGEALHE